MKWLYFPVKGKDCATLKILFRLDDDIEGFNYRLYVGGDRETPSYVGSIPTAVTNIEAWISSYGTGLDDWIVGVKYLESFPPYQWRITTLYPNSTRNWGLGEGNVRAHSLIYSQPINRIEQLVWRGHGFWSSEPIISVQSSIQFNAPIEWWGFTTWTAYDGIINQLESDVAPRFNKARTYISHELSITPFYQNNVTLDFPLDADINSSLPLLSGVNYCKSISSDWLSSIGLYNDHTSPSYSSVNEPTILPLNIYIQSSFLESNATFIKNSDDNYNFYKPIEPVDYEYTTVSELEINKVVQPGTQSTIVQQVQPLSISTSGLRSVNCPQGGYLRGRDGNGVIQDYPFPSGTLTATTHSNPNFDQFAHNGVANYFSPYFALLKDSWTIYCNVSLTLESSSYWPCRVPGDLPTLPPEEDKFYSLKTLYSLQPVIGGESTLYLYTNSQYTITTIPEQATNVTAHMTNTGPGVSDWIVGLKYNIDDVWSIYTYYGNNTDRNWFLSSNVKSVNAFIDLHPSYPVKNFSNFNQIKELQWRGSGYWESGLVNCSSYHSDITPSYHQQLCFWNCYNGTINTHLGSVASRMTALDGELNLVLDAEVLPGIMLRKAEATTAEGVSTTPFPTNYFLRNLSYVSPDLTWSTILGSVHVYGVYDYTYQHLYVDSQRFIETAPFIGSEFYQPDESISQFSQSLETLIYNSDRDELDQYEVAVRGSELFESRLISTNRHISLTGDASSTSTNSEEDPTLITYTRKLPNFNNLNYKPILYSVKYYPNSPPPLPAPCVSYITGSGLNTDGCGKLNNQGTYPYDGFVTLEDVIHEGCPAKQVYLDGVNLGAEQVYHADAYVEYDSACANSPFWVPPFIGGQCPVQYNLYFDVRGTGAYGSGIGDGQEMNPGGTYLNNLITGPITSYRIFEISPQAGMAMGATGANGEITRQLGGGSNWFDLRGIILYRLDGQPDNCGNLLPPIWVPPTPKCWRFYGTGSDGTYEVFECGITPSHVPLQGYPDRIAPLIDGNYIQGLVYPGVYSWLAGSAYGVSEAPNPIIRGSGTQHSEGSCSICGYAEPAPEPTVDPYAANVVFYLNGTDFIDAKGKSVSVVNPTISTAQFTSPPSSYLFNSNGYLSVPNYSDFYFGTNDFTIELWIYLAAEENRYRGLLCKISPDAGQFYSYINPNNTVGFSTQNYGGMNGTTPLTTNTWHHVAISRYNSLAKLFIGGVEDASTTITGLDNYNNPLYIGALDPSNGPYNWFFNGYMDGIRITQGVARYTTDFVPELQYAPLT